MTPLDPIQPPPKENELQKFVPIQPETSHSSMMLPSVNPVADGQPMPRGKDSDFAGSGLLAAAWIHFTLRIACDLPTRKTPATVVNPLFPPLQSIVRSATSLYALAASAVSKAHK